MRTLWRRLMRAEPVRLSAVALAFVLIVPLAAFGFAISSSLPGPGAVIAALALLAVAGSGLLYAWRLGAGGLAD